MSWLKKYIFSSIGKKQLMAVTGACLAAFLLVHFAGNATLLLPDPELREKGFLAVAETYANLKFILYVMEGGLVLLFGTHIFNALCTWLENKKARRQGYEVKTKVGKRGLPSFTMVISGLFLVTFLVFHIAAFKYGVLTPVKAASADIRAFGVDGNLYQIVIHWFSNGWFALFSIAAMLMLGFHLWHGVSSLFQTLGASHPKYAPIVKWVGRAYALAIGAGNAAIIAIVFLREVLK